MQLVKVSAALILLTTSFCSDASAVEGPCHGENLVEVRSISGLPADLAALLGANKKGSDGLAEPGAMFNATDVVQEAIPMRRFSIAGIGQDCALVAFERGGRGYSIIFEQLHRNSNGWNITYKTEIGTVAPKALVNILWYAAD